MFCVNIHGMVVSRLLHRCCVCTSSCYFHELLGSGYILHGPTMTSKCSHHKWTKYLSFCQRDFYCAEGSIVPKGLMHIIPYWSLGCVSIRQSKGVGGGGNCKRHPNTQVRVQLKVISDIQWVYENESVLLLGGFTLFILTWLGLGSMGLSHLDY